MSITPQIPVRSAQEIAFRTVEREKLQEASKAASSKASMQSSSYLSGFMGLTGICSGFALDTAERVEKWIRAGGPSSGGPIELAQSPTTRIQHYEKLLILAVFRSLKSGDEWREIRQTWDGPLVATIQRKYQELLKSQTGGVVRERLPEQGDFPTSEIPSILSRLQDAGSSDHFLIVFKNPDETMYKWHVVYLHPQSHLLADGANCLKWQGTSGADNIFLDTVGNHLRDKYSEFSNFFLHKMQFEGMPSRPLLYDRVYSRVETLARVALHSPLLGCHFAASYVLPRSVVSYFGWAESLEKEFYGKLQKLLKEKNFSEFMSYIERQIPRIPNADSLPDSDFEGDLRAYLPLLELLKERKSPYQEIAAWVQKGILEALFLPTRLETPVEERRQIIQGVLEARRILNRPYVLSYNSEFLLGEMFLMKNDYMIRRGGEFPQKYFEFIGKLCRNGDLNTLKEAVSYIGNPFLECASLNTSTSQISVESFVNCAMRLGYFPVNDEVVAYLASLRPIATT